MRSSATILVILLTASITLVSPVSSKTSQISIELTDSYGDGWSYTVVQIRQNGNMVAIFGPGFSDGSSYGPIYVNLEEGQHTQIVCIAKGYYADQVGFKVLDPSGSTIYQRFNGVSFEVGNVFTEFCLGDCLPKMNVLVQMTDLGGDGWNGNVLALMQNNRVVDTFGKDFQGAISTYTISVQVNKQVQIVVFKLGTKSQEIGFKVKNPAADAVLYERVSGNEFYSETIFSVFCPGSGCTASNLFTTLKIAMTDSGSDGWNGNILAIKQNGAIIATLGDDFVNGDSKGQVFIIIKKNIATSIAVARLGTKSEQIGFVVKNPDDSIIHQRTSGTAFYSGTVFSAFCPGGGCTDSLVLQITMLDAFGDGWQGNTIGFRQNGAIVATFGDDFTGGATLGPVYITIPGTLKTQIVPVNFRSYRNEIGFIIKDDKKRIIYQKQLLENYASSKIFVDFCPRSCEISLKLLITMTDSGADGWNGNALAIKQNEAIAGVFGNKFTSGASSGLVQIIVYGNVGARIVVFQSGTKNNEMGFIVRASNGTIIFQKYVGTTFVSNDIFATFCPINYCVDLMMLAVTMTDTAGNGWNYNIIGVKQNGVLIGKFGNSFTSGSSSGPVYVAINPNERTQIAVSQLGLKTNEIGFVIKKPDGTTIYQRTSGTTFTYTTVFTYFCPGVCSNTVALTITMTDSGSDGWNGNVLAIKQDNAVVDTFGGDFTSGGSSGPVTITVQGDKEVYIIVTALTTNTDQIGFVVTAANGTVIHQRKSGVEFNAGIIFLNFCPFGGCPTTNFLTLTITMTDSGSDGWNGNVLAIKQNNIIVGTFGGAFKSGGSADPVYITVQGDIEARVMFSQFGTKVNEIGFIVKASNRTTIFRKYTGTTYLSNKIFATFCPIANCPSDPNVVYTLTTTDSGSNGWQGTILAFKQNGAEVSTFTLASGAAGGPTPVTLPKYITTSIAVKTLGANSHQIGFKIVNSYGETVFQRAAGARLYVSTPLGSFCPECVNLGPVATATASGNPISQQSSYQIEDQNLNEVPTETSSQAHIIAIYVLSSVLILLVLLFLYFLKHKITRSAKPQQPEPQQPIQLVESIESAQSIEKNQQQ